jgi:hypothetical protein
LIKNPIVIVDSVGQRGGEDEETKVKRYRSHKGATPTGQRGYSQGATSIGINAPYKMQILLIQDLMGTRGPWPPEFKLDQVLIATADAFQGSEREFMFVSTVRTSYHGWKFTASLRRINVILSRGSIATFVTSNSRVFGRSDLGTGQKYKPDAKEGLEALQRLFERKSELRNVYTLDTWRRMFEGLVYQVTIVKEDIVSKLEDNWKREARVDGKNYTTMTSRHGMDVDGADRGKLAEGQSGFPNCEYPTYIGGHNGLLHSTVDR